jgi:hypothetical protein
MPEAAAAEFVVSWFWRLITRVLGAASIPRKTQCVLVERDGKFAGEVGEVERAGRVQDRRRYDLQQHGDRGNDQTETAAGPTATSALRPR